MSEPTDRGPALRVRPTGDFHHRLSDTEETRRLRTALDAVTRHEGALSGLVEFTWTSNGVAFVVCSTGDEVALAKAIAEELRDFNAASGLVIQAAREVMSAATIRRWNRRIEALLAAEPTEGR